MLILGIGGWLHDGSAALVLDGECVAAIEEEKLLRQRHPGGFPDRAVTACLKIAGARRKDVELVALSKPLEAGKEASALLHLKTLFPHSKTVIVDHHTAHAAAAFFPSPYENSPPQSAIRNSPSPISEIRNSLQSAIRNPQSAILSVRNPKFPW